MIHRPVHDGARPRPARPTAGASGSRLSRRDLLRVGSIGLRSRRMRAMLSALGISIGIAAIVGGRVFSMPHASKAGVVGVVLVFVAIIAYLVLPGIVRAMTGSGCV